VSVLTTARDLVEQDGFFGFIVDGLDTHSGNSKATIYRSWARLLGWEVSSCADRPAVASVEALDGVGGADDASDLHVVV